MLDYDARRLVDDPAYFNAVWQMYRDWYQNHEEHLLVPLEALDSFEDAARMQVIFGTTALHTGFEIDAGEATEWIRRTMQRAFNGLGVLGGNFSEVIAHIVVTLRTETYH